MIYGHKRNKKPYDIVRLPVEWIFFLGFYAFANVIAQWRTILIKKRDKHVKQPM